MTDNKETQAIVELAMGAIMTQVALCRFLIQENVIQKDRVVTFLEERGEIWSKTASNEALISVVTLMTALASNQEPSFPSTGLH